jgi:hypothetical protein
LFNVALLAFVAAFFLYRSRRDQDVLIIPSLLLITPQAWYVFSYVNNDAFPLALSFLAAYEIAYPQSSLNRWMSGDGTWRGAVQNGLLIGLILISKSNYYAFLIFAGMWLLYPYLPLRRDGSPGLIDTTLLRRLGSIALVAIAVLAVRCSLDFYVNGETNFVGVSYLNYFAGNFEKQESRLMKYQEEIADPQFKPSAIERDLASTSPDMRLKDKGVPYRDIFSKWRWHETSFKSFVGAYGYMTIFASDWYYRVMMLLYTAFAAFVVVMIVRRGAGAMLFEISVLCLGVAISIFVSSYLSWSYAFQAQGRYLFPILPMAAAFLYAVRERLSRPVFTLFVIIGFMLSAYSFIFVGIAKVDSPPATQSAEDATSFTSRAMIRVEER